MSVKNVLGDLQIVVERHSEVLRNHSLPFRFLIILRLIGFLLSYLYIFRIAFWLQPANLTSLQVWRIPTAAFCGHNLIDVIWTVWSLHFGTNLVRLNNSNESLLKLYAITQGLTTLIIVILTYLLYIFFNSIRLFYIEPIVGLIPINAAVLVLMKQFLPDTIVLSTPIGRIKYTHLPFLAISVSLALALLKITYFTSFLQVLVGVQVSWTYLRFYKLHETDEIYGDGSEHFTWASLFPSRTQLVFTLIGRICFRTLARLGVCKRQVRHVDLNSLQSVAVGINLPAIENSAKDSERRRQKALRELNERLSKTRNAETRNYGNWDEDDDDEKTTTTTTTVTAKTAVEAKTSSTSVHSPSQDDRNSSVSNV